MVKKSRKVKNEVIISYHNTNWCEFYLGVYLPKSDNEYNICHFTNIIDLFDFFFFVIGDTLV